MWLHGQLRLIGSDDQRVGSPQLTTSTMLVASPAMDAEKAQTPCCEFLLLLKESTGSGSSTMLPNDTTTHSKASRATMRETARTGQNAGGDDPQHNRNDAQHRGPNGQRNDRTDLQESRNNKDGQRSLTGGGTPRIQGGTIPGGYVLRKHNESRKQRRRDRREAYTHPGTADKTGSGGEVTAGPDTNRLLVDLLCAISALTSLLQSGKLCACETQAQERGCLGGWWQD